MVHINYFSDYSSTRAHAITRKRNSRVIIINDFYCVVTFQDEKVFADLTKSCLETLLLFKQGYSLDETIKIRKLSKSTIISKHLNCLIKYNQVKLSDVGVKYPIETVYKFSSHILSLESIESAVKIKFCDAQSFDSSITFDDVKVICSEIYRKIKYNEELLDEFKSLSDKASLNEDSNLEDGIPFIVEDPVVERKTKKDRIISKVLFGIIEIEFIKKYKTEINLKELLFNKGLTLHGDVHLYLKDEVIKYNREKKTTDSIESQLKLNTGWCGTPTIMMCQSHAWTSEDIDYVQKQKAPQFYWDFIQRSPYFDTELCNRFKVQVDFKELSDNHWFGWDYEQIVKYEAKVDFNNLSSNPLIKWDYQLIDTFKNKINWSLLSCNSGLHWNIEGIQRYENYIDWASLSKSMNIEWSIFIVEKYIKKWDWAYLIQNKSFYSLFDVNILLKKHNLLINKLFSDSLDDFIGEVNQTADVDFGEGADIGSELLSELIEGFTESKLVIDEQILNILFKVEDIAPQIHTEYRPKELRKYDYDWDKYVDYYETEDVFYSGIDYESIALYIIKNFDITWTSSAIELLESKYHFILDDEEIVVRIKHVSPPSLS